VGAESLAIGSEHTAVGDGTSCVDLMKGTVRCSDEKDDKLD
jgi:hypothetical protein